mgnify:CR=1 FL=1
MRRDGPELFLVHPGGPFWKNKDDGSWSIAKGEIDQLKDAMKQGMDVGMLTFDESLYRLYSTGRISFEDALDNADSRTDLALRLQRDALRFQTAMVDARVDIEFS